MTGLSAGAMSREGEIDGDYMPKTIIDIDQDGGEIFNKSSSKANLKEDQYGLGGGMPPFDILSGNMVIVNSCG